MKVVFVTENLGSGGAERQLTRLAALFKKAGHSVCVVTWGSRKFHADYLHENGIDHVMIPDYPRVKRIIGLAKIYRDRRPDVVISYLPMANETAIIARWMTKVPQIIVSERSFTDSWPMRTRLRYFLYRFADHIVANSNNEAENILANVSSLKKKTFAIPNFVETDKFAPKDKIETEAEIIRLVSVGRVIASKNVLSAVLALKKVIDAGYNCKLDWYGDTYDQQYVSEVEKLSYKLGLRNRFFIRGESDQIHRLLPEYDVFFFPSLLEGYPNVLCEAMSCGLPAVSSNACEMPYILEEGRGGYLFDPNDIEAMTTALCKILDASPEQRQAMGAYNRAKIVKYNSPQNIFNKYLALL